MQLRVTTDHAERLSGTTQRPFQSLIFSLQRRGFEHGQSSGQGRIVIADPILGQVFEEFRIGLTQGSVAVEPTARCCERPTIARARTSTASSVTGSDEAVASSVGSGSAGTAKQPVEQEVLRPVWWLCWPHSR